MLIFKFRGKLIEVNDMSFPEPRPSDLRRYNLLFGLYSYLNFLNDINYKTVGILKTVCILRWREIFLPFYCLEIERNVKPDMTLSFRPRFQEFLNIIVSPFVSECFSESYKLALNFYLLGKDWSGIIFCPNGGETEEESYEIGVAYLSLENE